jgi:branched-chain amino acid transport system permease protein
VVGGLTSLPGAVLGGLLVGITESFAGGYIDSSMTEVSPFIAIMLILVFRPTGLFSLRAARRV